ncbi:hypothetical protein GE061_019108 [Apolygus lucorum]|uniref:Uncharacterized protein n=1 Tax=Apolygus lucorum TaxID=248454 RepID=A0A6A4J7Q0_APOLU|nr:hypothetical protein GE061_019108 [Apolygus lucorum]
MSSFKFAVALLLVVAVVAQDEIADEEVEGRTFGHLAKPLKKLGHRLGQYLVYATSDNYYPHQYHPPIVHHNNHFGGYYGGYQPGYAGHHAPGFVGGFRDIDV